jgi:F-box and leucine-rich repeat protein GRR1
MSMVQKSQTSQLCPILHKLSIRRCIPTITDLSIIAIANNCHFIESLEDDVSQLTDASILALANNCPELRNLDISSCRNFSETAIVKLLEKCAKLHTKSSS